MSAKGEALFDLGLKYFFNAPKNFTDQCNEPMRENDVELVSCRTICLTIYQDLYVWGEPLFIISYLAFYTSFFLFELKFSISDS